MTEDELTEVLTLLQVIALGLSRITEIVGLALFRQVSGRAR